MITIEIKVNGLDLQTDGENVMAVQQPVEVDVLHVKTRDVQKLARIRRLTRQRKDREQ